MILELKNIEFSYNGSPVLRGIEFAVRKGEIISILGVNGAGKSTLLKCINGILKPQKGEIFIDHINIKKTSRTEIAKALAYVPQRSEQSFITVFDAVLLGRKPYIKWDVTKNDIEITERVLSALGLKKFSLRYINELSGGEFQKVVIARALVQQPKVILLDEPTNNLDPKNQFEVIDIIKKNSKRKGISSVIVMHNVNLAVRLSDRFVLLKEGKVFAEGGLEIITKDNIEKVYGISVTVENIRGITVILPYGKKEIADVYS
ncbi:MAG: ABC transporter ATP-binding protein [Candidatus Caldatribacteriota bacterium]|nr:ABC transporter ATP-binding protein [Candidatus Caldatribacteriota bacterium]